MGQPEKEFRLGNIVKAILDGRDDWYDALDRDLNVLFQSLDVLVDCFKASFDADGNVRTQQPTRELDIITTNVITTDGSTQYPLATRIDTATEIIGFVTNDDTRLFEGIDYTYDSFNLYLTTATPSGTQIQYSLIQNTAGLLDDIRSITDGLGSYLIGHPDDNNEYQSSTVGDALDEVMAKLVAFINDVGPTSNVLKADGSVPLTQDWLVNLRKPNGTAVQATGAINVTGTPTHLDSFTVFDGNIGLGVTFGLTAAVIRAVGSVEFTANPLPGDTITMTDTAGASITFEFYPLGGPDNTDPNNQGVMLGATSSITESNFRNSVTVSAVLDITGEVSDTAVNPTGNYTQGTAGTAGNTAITVVAAPSSSIVATGFAGGLDETPAGQIPVTIDADPLVTAANISAAINTSLLTISSSVPAGSSIVNLIHDTAVASANIPIEQTFSGGQALTITGMGGGQSGILGDLCARRRLRNMPPSVRDGDAVVHEQLRGVANSLLSITDKFVALDGSRSMTGDLKMGNNRVVQASPARDGTDYTILSQVQELIDAAVLEVNKTEPPGTIRVSASSTVPEGWLQCNGAEVSRSQYPNLWEAIQNDGWGFGNGSTTFQLPDVRGRAIIGAGAAVGLSPREVGDVGGEEVHLLVTDEIPPHQHEIKTNSSGQTINVNDDEKFSGDSGSVRGLTATTGGGQAHNNMQPFAAFNVIVKT